MSEVDLRDWGIRRRDQKEPDKRTVAARVPPAVHDAWTSTVEAISTKFGAPKGDVAAVGMVLALENVAEWERLVNPLSTSPAAEH